MFETKCILRSDSGEVIATYDKIRSQNNGITFVFNKFKDDSSPHGWGVVKDNKEIISPQFLNIRDYQNGFAIFTTVDSHQGAIDKDGNIAIQPDFYKIDGFNKNGISVVSYDDGTDNLIDTCGKAIFSNNSCDFYSFDNGYFDIINKDGLHAIANPSGEIITKFEYSEIFEDDDDVSLFTAEKDDTEIVINSIGKEITHRHDEVTILPVDCIIAYDYDISTLTMYNKSGNTIISKKCDIDFHKTSDVILSFFKTYPNATVTTDGSIITSLEDYFSK